MDERHYQPGEQVPGTVYRVVRLIGAGGMGTVYDVEDTTIGKRYVLKTLHPQLGAREDLARRMQNEARTLARLNHPNIVEVFTAGVTADDLHLPYYVMERLNGQSLRLVLEKKGVLDAVHAYHIAIDLLDALDHAHDKGVIHRDVKPDNIFLHRTSAGVTLTKLLDFGIVSLLDGAAQEPSGKFLGTLRYAAPEQLRGETLSARVDVYAAGLVLYEMLAGRGPFDDEGDPHRISMAHLQKPAPLISTFLDVPRELDALLAATLSKDPSVRPRDAFSFAASLRSLKRELQATAARELTGDRATASAIVSPSSPSTRDEMNVAASGLAFDPTQLQATTRQDVSAPVPQPSTPSPSVVATATSAAVDRAAHTRTSASDAPPAPQQGTEAVSIASMMPPGPAQSVSPVAPPVVASPSWPAERPLDGSEAPQVRSLPIGPPASRPRRNAVAMLAGLGLLSLLAVSMRTSRRASNSAPVGADMHLTAAAVVSPGPVPSVAVAPTPPSATPVVDVAPAPSSTPVAPPSAAGGSNAVSAPIHHANASPPVVRRKATSAASTASTAVPVASVKPGPGF